MHKSVLLKESIEGLNIKQDGPPNGEVKKYIDATLGAGGHTREILSRGGSVLGLDQDESMLEVAKNNLKDLSDSSACPFFKLVKTNFRNIDTVARDNEFFPVDGILMDLGVASHHFDDQERGFSFRFPEAELDMRLDKSLGVKAKDLLNSLPERNLAELFESKSLAKKIIEKRSFKSFETVNDLLKLFPPKHFGKVHSATKAFMDLRIAVNSELDTLRETLPRALSLLADKGRLVIISFHSGEDRIVKEFFDRQAKSGDFMIITRRVVVPSSEEISINPKARSAKMRILEKNEKKEINQSKINNNII